MLVGKSDEAQFQASRLAAGGAAREESVGGAFGAWTHNSAGSCHLPRRLFELIGHDCAQVEVRFAFSPSGYVILRADDFGSEAVGEVLANFETAWADRGAEC